MRVILLPILAILLSSPVYAGEHSASLAEDSQSADLTGIVDYELFDNSNYSILAKGRIRVRKSDILVTKNVGNFDKEIKLHNQFYFGIAIFREQPGNLPGFGLLLKNKSMDSFS